MAKRRRNAPCPCGSGRKYKKCCGDPRKAQRASGIGRSHIVPEDIERELKRIKARELIRTEQQGLGRPIIEAKSGEYQFVAVGDSLYRSKNWRFFSDFLSDYIKQTLGADWGRAEIVKPVEQRHPIMQWYDTYCRFQRQHPKQPDGTYAANATGVVYCFLGLAYSLYLLKHNVELQQRFVARLRNVEQFQGAYYELIIAHCLIRAGFELTLEDEADQSAKHCEFSALSKHTKKKYWVEAKMRAVSGLLGRTDVDGSAAKAKPTSKLSEHLRKALKKPATEERLIFIDVNAPPMERSANNEMPEWMTVAIRQLNNRERDLKGDERAYLFVTNMSFHRSLSGEAPGHAVLAYGLGIPDFSKPGEFRLSETWKRKQKHIDAHHIMDALRSYPKIPSTFDGSLPLSPSDAENRIEIGQTYFFDCIGEGGAFAEVTSGTVSEHEKRLYIGVMTEDGKGQILTRDLSDGELAAYKAHPDAYFGEIRHAGGRVNSPYELFEWFVECYQATPREKLLEFCKGHPDVEALAKLEHGELVLEVCEWWTAAAVAQDESLRSP